MSQDYLNPDNTPQAISKVHQGKYLGKGPIIILGLVLAAVAYAILIAANKRAQQNVQIDRAETIESAETVAGNNLDSWLEKQPGGTIDANRSELEEPEVLIEGALIAPEGQTSTSQALIPSEALEEEPVERDLTPEEVLYQKYLDKRLAEHVAAADSDAIASSWDSKSNLGGLSDAVSGLTSAASRGGNIENPLQDLLLKRLETLQGGGNTDQNNQAGKKEFAGSKSDPDWYLAKTRDLGLTNYEVKTGSVIPGVLLTGMNSDLPGQVIGQIRQNVYDTATGQHLLLPQGTRIYGEYDSEVSYGQKRGLVVWRRLVFPDASTIDINGMQGNDIGGYSGFKDRVNNHYGRIFGSVLLLSVFNALPELVRDDDNGGASRIANSNSSSTDSFEVVEIEREQLVRNDDGTTRVVTLTEQVIVPVRSSSSSASETENQANASTSGRFNERIQEQIALNNSRIGERLTEKNLEIQPTIKIRPGYEFNIIVNKDIVFDQPYTAIR